MNQLKKYSSLLFLLTALFTTIFINLSCDDNPVTPNEPPPGSRDYTWDVDTLTFPFNSFYSITGASPNDLWICGPGDSRSNFVHYNGISWEAYENTDNSQPFIEPKDIYSLNSENIWSCGREGNIFNFDGMEWKKNYKLSFSNTNDITFETIYAISNQDIITAGQFFNGKNYWGIILRYDGISWTQLNIPTIRTAFADIKMSNSKDLFLMGVSYEPSGESNYQFYKLNKNELLKIYTATQTPDENGNLIQLADKTYFIIGHNLFTYSNSNFTQVCKLTKSSKFLNVGVGRNINDIFLGMRDGIVHYNGENSIYLFKTSEDIYVRRGCIFEKDVYFLASASGGNTLIIHGTLNSEGAKSY